MAELKRNRKGELILRPVHPNAGIEADYRRRLLALVDEMHRSVLYWLKAAYRRNEPKIAQDDIPASALRDAMQKLSKRWLDRFDVASEELAEYFATAVKDRSDAVLKNILKKGGFSVQFKMTPAMRDVLGASVNANVSLIKSIPQQYLTQVEGIVMRSVQSGRDLGQLTADLQKQFGITRRRAAFIALDQNNKATEALGTARKIELGLDEEIWVHSGGGKHPRPTHVQAGKDKVRYQIKQGWYDPAVKQYIRPGQLVGCRCVGRPVIRGFS